MSENLHAFLRPLYSLLRPRRPVRAIAPKPLFGIFASAPQAPMEDPCDLAIVAYFTSSMLSPHLLLK